MNSNQTTEVKSKKDLKIRAIYIGDVRFDSCPVFELNTETNQFVMLSDNDFRYDDLAVYDDKDFLVFEVYKEEIEDLYISDDEDLDGSENEIETVKML